MVKYASKVVEQAKAWLGLKESDGSYQVILDTYNSQKVLPRGYRMTLNDPWCAAFVSAVAVKLGYTDIVPTECSCSKMIAKLKAIGSWEERDNVVPLPGWLCFFNWSAKSTGDDVGDPDHVGIVEEVKNGTITVIEGNYSNSVKRRYIPVDYQFIRGYGVPKYDAEPAPAKVDYTLGMRYLKRGCEGEDVRALQILLKGRGYNGSMNTPDGIFGPRTDGAVKAYQKAKGLVADGIVGEITMGSLLGL